jgi:hypothetical protein
MTEGIILTLTKQDLYRGLKAFTKLEEFTSLESLKSVTYPADIFHNTKTATKCTDTLLII